MQKIRSTYGAVLNRNPMPHSFSWCWVHPKRLGRKTVRARGSGNEQFSKHDRKDACINSWLLWQPAQDLWTLNPDDVQEWRGEGFRKSYRWLRSYWQLIVSEDATPVKSSIFQELTPTQKHSVTQIGQWIL